MSILSSTNIPNTISASEALRKLKESVALLERSEHKGQPMHNKLMAITLNNLACYYKRYT